MSDRSPDAGDFGRPNPILSKVAQPYPYKRTEDKTKRSGSSFDLNELFPLAVLNGLGVDAHEHPVVPLRGVLGLVLSTGLPAHAGKLRGMTQ